MKLKFWEKDQDSLNATEKRLYDDLSQQLEEKISEASLNSAKALSTTKVNESIPAYADKATLQRLYVSEGWLYIAVHTIAKQIAQLPISLQKKVMQKEEMVQPDGTTFETEKETWVDANALKYIDPWKNPNPDTTSVELIMLILIDLLTTGDSYIFINDSNLEDNSDSALGRLRRAMDNKSEYTLHRISSPTVIPRRDKITGYVSGYVMSSEDGQYFFKKSEMIHIQMPNPTDRDNGLAPIVPVLKKLMLDKYNTEHLIRFFKQGARLGGVIKTTKNLTKEQVSRLERTFESNYTGKSNFHRTLILPNGMDYKTIESSPSDSNIQQIQESNKEQILSAYGLPPIKVGLLDGASFANANVQNKTFYSDTITPLLTLIVAALNSNKTLVDGKPDLRFGFDTSGVEALQSDSIEKGEIARGMAATGLSINEIRKRVWQVGAIEGGHIIPAIHKMQVADAYSGSNGQSNQVDGQSNQVDGQSNQVDGEDGVVGGQNRNDEPVNDPAPNPEDNAKNLKSINDAANVQNDTEALSDVVETNVNFEERVIALTQNAVGQGVEYPVALRSAIQQALSEGLAPTPNESGISEEKTENSQENLDRFGEEFLVEFQKGLTGEGTDSIINFRKKAVSQLYKNQLGRVIDALRANNKSLKTKEIDISPESVWDALTPTKNEVSLIASKEAFKKGWEGTLFDINYTVEEVLLSDFINYSSTQLITRINETTRNEIFDILEKSRANNDTMDEVVGKINGLSEIFSKGRAEKIARTEVLAEVSVAQDIKRQTLAIAYPEHADKMLQMWVSARDGSVRSSHDDLDGETIGVNEQFSNGLFYPRDMAGEAKEVINCRCTSIDFFEDDTDLIIPSLDMNKLLSVTEEIMRALF